MVIERFGFSCSSPPVGEASTLWKTWDGSGARTGGGVRANSTGTWSDPPPLGTVAVNPPARRA